MRRRQTQGCGRKTRDPPDFAIFSFFTKFREIPINESAIHGGQLFCGILPLTLRPVDMWKSALKGRTRLKGVDKSVDGQKDARPPTCPRPAAFPHTHRRNSKDRAKARARATSPTIPVGQLFLRLPAAIRKEEKEVFSNGAGYSQNCSLVQ